MKNGYYLSCYIEFDPIGNLYHYARRHDQNIALWKLEDGFVKLIHYWELERLTGYKKHQVAFYNVAQFERIMNELLKPYGIIIEDIVEIYGTPELHKSEEYLSLMKYSDYTYHTMCHLASCIFMETEIYEQEKILAFSVDGGSDIVADKDAMKRYAFAGCYSDSRTQVMELFPVFSPAVLWDYLSSRYGMQEGSLMALASASESIVYYQLDANLFSRDCDENTAFWYMNQLIEYVEELTSHDEGTKFNYFDSRFSEEENRISMVMKIVQQISCEIMKNNINQAIQAYQINTEEVYLAMSGGFALNCPCNTYLMKEFQFKGFVAPPCVSDSGMALGIGLYAFSEAFHRKFHFSLKNAYYGDRDDLESFISSGSFKKFIDEISDFDEEQIITDIEAEPIVWFDGQAEIGPRALGARSIIGDPRKGQVKDKLNLYKQRQWWRPVAPIVLKNKVGEWFEESYDSPYMLHAFKIKECKQDEVVAIVHSDGTARLQTVDEDSLLYKVMIKFYEQTGVPMLCNTSLNDKGEPIINKIDEAINFALRKGIPVIYVNGTRIHLVNHLFYEEHGPLKRKVRIEYWNDDKEFKELLESNNPLHASANVLFYYTYFKLNNLELLKSKDEVRKMQLSQKLFVKNLPSFIRKKMDQYCCIDQEN